MSSVNKAKLYDDLLSAYTKAHSETKNKRSIQDNVNQIWKSVKNNVQVANLVEDEIKKLNIIKSKRQASLLKFWAGVSEKENVVAVVPSNVIEEKNKSPNKITCTATTSNEIATVEVVATSTSESNVSTEATTRSMLTPAQNKTKNEMLVLDSEIATLKHRKNFGFLNDDMAKELGSKKKKMEQLRQLVKKQEKEMLRHRKRRLQKKRNFDKICTENPELRKRLNVRGKTGRPRIEYDQPFLLQAIIDLALHGSAAHERRRDDTIRTVKTLDDLVDKLREDYGFTLSRSAAYLRLLPRKANTIEGKRHVYTAPVKIIRASNDSHKQHIDSKFAATTINHIHELASLLGPKEVTYISQDDKAKVPIGMPAANKQAPLLMHMQYRYFCEFGRFLLNNQRDCSTNSTILG